MRPAIKLLLLWLILMSVSLGGLRQAISGGWSGADGQSHLLFSQSCGSDTSDRHHAPTVCLLKYCCAPSSSNDDESGLLKAILASWRIFISPFRDERPFRHPEGRSVSATPADQASTPSTGPPVRS